MSDQGQSSRSEPSMEQRLSELSDRYMAWDEKCSKGGASASVLQEADDIISDLFQVVNDTSRAPRSEQRDSDREGRSAIMDRTIYHRMLTDLCSLILGSAVPIGPMRSRNDYPPELAKAIKWLKDVQDREMSARRKEIEELEAGMQALVPLLTK